MSIEVSRQQEHQLRRMGREAVSKAIKAANEGTGGMRRVTAKVTKVNADYTIDVDMGDSQYAMPITGLRYTTACAGVAVGDTVLVDVVGHLATVTGILATSDNGPYVRLLWEGTASKNKTFTVPGINDYSVIGVMLGVDGAILLGARYEERAAGGLDQFHCGAIVNGTTSYWAQLKVSGNNVQVTNSGMYNGNVTRIYGYVRRH